MIMNTKRPTIADKELEMSRLRTENEKLKLELDRLRGSRTPIFGGNRNM